jgi:hemoglobin-like flavoprotein
VLTDNQKAAIRRSWQLVVPIADTAADLFYKRLFELAPSYRALFGDDMAPQKRKLVAMLAFIVRTVDWEDGRWKDSVKSDDDLFLVVLALGLRHAELYRIPDESYDIVGQALIWTLDYGLGEAFTSEVRDAWARVYGLVAQTMRMGKCAHGEGSAMALRANDA